jgi:hypothetical protein
MGGLCCFGVLASRWASLCLFKGHVSECQTSYERRQCACQACLKGGKGKESRLREGVWSYTRLSGRSGGLGEIA